MESITMEENKEHPLWERKYKELLADMGNILSGSEGTSYKNVFVALKKLYEKHKKDTSIKYGFLTPEDVEWLKDCGLWEDDTKQDTKQAKDVWGMLKEYLDHASLVQSIEVNDIELREHCQKRLRKERQNILNYFSLNKF